MKKFLKIYLGGFIALPLVACILVYLLRCFVSWSIIQEDIDWLIVRFYLVLAAIPSFFLSLDKDL
jgi:hypothetical protein